MSAEPAGPDDDGPTWASGLLPPDGAAWPPEPVAAPPAPEIPDSLPPTPRRPDGASIDDWRTMPVDSPDGYRGSATAPPLPQPRWEPWSVVALVCAVVGAIPYTWGLPLLPVAAIAFGITGRRACSLDPTLRGKAMATGALVAGVVELLVIFGALTQGAVEIFG